MGAEGSASELTKLRESAVAAEEEMKRGKSKLLAAASELKRLVSTQGGGVGGALMRRALPDDFFGAVISCMSNRLCTTFNAPPTPPHFIISNRP